MYARISWPKWGIQVPNKGRHLDFPEMGPIYWQSVLHSHAFKNNTTIFCLYRLNWLVQKSTPEANKSKIFVLKYFAPLCVPSFFCCICLLLQRLYMESGWNLKKLVTTLQVTMAQNNWIVGLLLNSFCNKHDVGSSHVLSWHNRVNKTSTCNRSRMLSKWN